jgi:CheY-like chemotaxis protein
MSRRSVLIVDDDPDIREILAETLVDKGFDVATAANGLEALRILRSMSFPPSVILLDLMMPIMDGYGFLEQRRCDPTLASIPLAIVTAGHGVDHDRLGDGLQIIPKPFEVSRLVGVLHTLGSEGGQTA